MSIDYNVQCPIKFNCKILFNSNTRQMTLRKNGRNAGAYSFQNSFFYLQFPDDLIVYSQNNSMNPALRAALITQRKTKRFVIYFLSTLCFDEAAFYLQFFHFVCLCLQNRRGKLNPQKQRSKYIAKPEAVVEAGNHFVWEFVTGKGSLNVPADAGILHHYRVSYQASPNHRNFNKKRFFKLSCWDLCRYVNLVEMDVSEHRP